MCYRYVKPLSVTQIEQPVHRLSRYFVPASDQLDDLYVTDIGQRCEVVTTYRSYVMIIDDLINAVTYICLIFGKMRSMQ